jgi:hypothetical protein
MQPNKLNTSEKSYNIYYDYLEGQRELAERAMRSKPMRTFSLKQAFKDIGLQW